MNIQNKPPEKVFIEFFDGKLYKCIVSRKFVKEGNRFNLILTERIDDNYHVGYEFYCVGESAVKYERGNEK